MSKARDQGGQGRTGPHFTLVVATSADGYISRSTDEPPQAWASPEEQDLFFKDVDAADWAVMGRNTHLAADKADRRRIIFSTTTKGWQRPTQFWVDPAGLLPSDLEALVSRQHICKHCIILGGTRVHDWFREHDAIDQVHLTIEPVTFETGLPVFSDSSGDTPKAAIARTGLKCVSDKVLNTGGTRYLVWTRET